MQRRRRGETGFLTRGRDRQCCPVSLSLPPNPSTKIPTAAASSKPSSSPFAKKQINETPQVSTPPTRSSIVDTIERDTAHTNLNGELLLVPPFHSQPQTTDLFSSVPLSQKQVVLSNTSSNLSTIQYYHKGKYRVHRSAISTHSFPLSNFL